MRKLKLNLSIAILLFATLTNISCKNNNEEGSVDHSGMEHENMNGAQEMMEGGADASKDLRSGQIENSQTGRIVTNYLKIKDALVADNTADATKAGESLVTAFEKFDMTEYDEGQQQELTEIIEDAKEHAEHITMREISHQR